MNTTVWFSVVAGVALVLIDVAVPLSAWRRVRGVGRSDGVSVFGIGVLAGTFGGWVAVAVLAHAAAAAIATTMWFVFHALMCREVLRVRPGSTRLYLAAATGSAAAMAMAAAAGAVWSSAADGLGVGLGVATAAYALPALYAGMTCRSTAGLSLVSMLINAVAGGLYLAAGLGLGGVSPAGTAVLGYTVLGGLELLANVPRLTRTGLRRARGRDRAVVRLAGGCTLGVGHSTGLCCGTVSSCGARIVAV